MPAYLTDAQKEAIAYEGEHLLITAGPGAGKTDTIVRRVVYLVQKGYFKPEEIVIITFTIKAAEELNNRLRKYLGKDTAGLQVSTIHSFCNQLLKSYPDYHGWKTGYDILDDREQFLFVYARMNDLGLRRFPKTRQGEFIYDVIAFYNLCTEEQVNINDLQQLVSEDGAGLLKLKKAKPEAVEEYAAVVASYEIYRELLLKEGLLDYASLQSTLYNMLNIHPDVCKEISQKYRLFLVDEYQDTNRLQVEILRLLTQAGGNVTAVGDEDQSIYRFRGATVSSFLRFTQDFPGAKEVVLDKNFRSTPALVKASSSLIQYNDEVRTNKPLHSGRDNTEGAKPIIFEANTCTEEATGVVNLLRTWKEEGIITSYNHVALLFRSVKYHAGEYIQALEEQGVPFYVRSDGGFFEREDIYQLKELFKFCGWKKKWDVKCLQGKILELSPQAVKAVVKHNVNPERWTDKDVLDELGITDNSDRQLMMDVANLRERTCDGSLNDLMELFYELLHSSGYFANCCSCQLNTTNEEWDAALLNLAQFSQLLDAFQRHARTQNTYRLGDYLRTIPARSLDSLRPEPEEAVQIMTIHQSKGLEFPLVVIGSAMEGRFPQKFRNSKYPVPGKLRLSKDEDNEKENLYDQRRSFYVGMTRAEDLLVVGAPAKVNKRGGGPSRFVGEVGTKFLYQDESTMLESVKIDNNKVGVRRGATPGTSTSLKSISYTALHSYLLCPLQYKILYDCEFAVPRRNYFRFGGVLHSCLEKIHRQALAGEFITPSEAEAVFLEHWKPERSMDVKKEEDQKNLGITYLRQYIENYADNFARVHWVEEPIELYLGNCVCTGRIDIALIGQTGLEIIDFKARTKKGLTVLKPDYQLYTYGLAVHETKNNNIEKLAVHLLAEKPGEEVEVLPWNLNKAQETKSLLEDALRGIESGHFEATPGDHCALCDFNRLCPHSFNQSK